MEFHEYVRYIYIYYTLRIISITAILFYYFTTYILCLPAISQTFNNELLEKIFISLTYFKTYIIYTLFPLVIILPDIAYNFIRSIYFPTPIDIIIYNQKKYKQSILSEEQNLDKNKVKDPFCDYENTLIKDNINNKKLLKKNTIKHKIDNVEVYSNNNIEYDYNLEKLNNKNTSIKTHNNDNGLEEINGNDRIRKPSINNKSKNISSYDPSNRSETEKLKSRKRAITSNSINENMDFNLNEGNAI